MRCLNKHADWALWPRASFPIGSAWFARWWSTGKGSMIYVIGIDTMKTFMKISISNGLYLIMV